MPAGRFHSGADHETQRSNLPPPRPHRSRGGLLLLHVPADPKTRPAIARDETVAIAPGPFLYRLPGEFLKADRIRSMRPSRPPSFRGRSTSWPTRSARPTMRVALPTVPARRRTARWSEPGDLPVTGVSFRDATAYAAVAVRNGRARRWRLPTDEEWAFAAAERFTDDALGVLGRRQSRHRTLACALPQRNAGSEGRDPKPKPRGHFGANGQRAADIAGNVWEWTTTCYTRARSTEAATSIRAPTIAACASSAASIAATCPASSATARAAAAPRDGARQSRHPAR